MSVRVRLTVSMSFSTSCCARRSQSAARHSSAGAVSNGAQLFVFQWLACRAPEAVLSLIGGPFRVGLFNKGHSMNNGKRRINPIFRGFLARLSQPTQTA
jgi:hypothetical protein